MRIISKFKDYYDGGMGLGHESSIVYVRQTTDLEDCSAFKDLIYGMKIIKQSLNRNLHYTQTVSVSIIVICNKLFLKLNDEIFETIFIVIQIRRFE